MRPRLTAALALVAALGGGCQTAVGNYFSNRARDFGQCWRAEVHAGMGVYLDAKASGIAHIGVGGRVSSARLGWRYGTPISRTVGMPAEGAFGLIHFSQLSDGDHLCFGLLPGLASWHPDDWNHPATWVGDPSIPDHERQRLWDVEATVHILWGGLTVGFSPTDFIDFLLGWFGVDIAGDDTEWKPPPK